MGLSGCRSTGFRQGWRRSGRGAPVLRCGTRARARGSGSTPEACAARAPGSNEEAGDRRPSDCDAIPGIMRRGTARASVTIGVSGQASRRVTPSLHSTGGIMSKCRYCNSTSYGSGCSYSPHKKHEHTDDERKCEFCGSSSYGSGCSYSPAKKHRHGHGANKCVWCGSTSSGSGCSYSPNRVHEK